MPQLPSGLHIALDSSPIQTLLDNAIKGFKTHELMAIESIDQLFSHIDILYFRSRKDKSKEILLATFSMVPPENLEPYQSGYNLKTIKEEFDKWDNQDQRAFLDFLNEKRINNQLECLLDAIKKCQQYLLEHPDSIQGLLATWWKLGCHPLQEDDDEY